MGVRALAVFNENMPPSPPSPFAPESFIKGKLLNSCPLPPALSSLYSVVRGKNAPGDIVPH